MTIFYPPHKIFSYNTTRSFVFRDNMSEFQSDAELNKAVADLVIDDAEQQQNLEKKVSKTTTQKLLLNAVKQWEKTILKQYLGEQSDAPGEVICCNMNDLDSDPRNLVLFCGINPGQAPEKNPYTIKQNIKHLNSELPVENRWYWWNTYCRNPGIIMTKLFPERFTYKGETKEEPMTEDIRKQVLYTNSSFFRTVDQKGVTSDHLAISSPLLMQMVNMVKFPIIAFGNVPASQIAKLYSMYQIAEYPSGWSDWKIRFYKNHNNIRMIQVPHFQFMWATKTPEETWDAIRNFFN